TADEGVRLVPVHAGVGRPAAVVRRVASAAIRRARTDRRVRREAVRRTSANVGSVAHLRYVAVTRRGAAHGPGRLWRQGALTCARYAAAYPAIRAGAGDVQTLVSIRERADDVLAFLEADAHGGRRHVLRTS